ncbi:glycosyltransferase [Salinibacter ruber]|uniref:glycosyltransferase n=1 Tax=Salinibacter ruber TaxID=146919 RepID=UPI002073358F|nr:glycosyltransferase [Salinibacter ruber]
MNKKMGDIDAPFVSVIVPVYNDAERLGTCLGALEAQTYPAESYEVIVVDNNSDEEIEDVAQASSHAVYEFEEKQGSYAARNRGLHRAQGNIFAFTDADCIPTGRWIEAGAQCLYSTDADYIGGPVEIFVSDSEDPSPAGLFDALVSFRQHDNLEQKGFSATANLFTTRDVMQSVGKFDDRLKGGGDREWGRRAAQNGFEASFCKEAKVRHPARESISELVQKAQRVATGRFKEEDFKRRSWLEVLLYVLNQLRPPLGLAHEIMKLACSKSKRVQVLWVCMVVRWARASQILRLWLSSTSDSFLSP